MFYDGFKIINYVLRNNITVGVVFHLPTVDVSPIQIALNFELKPYSMTTSPRKTHCYSILRW